MIVSVWFHLCSHLPWFLLLPGLSLDWPRIFELTLWRTFIEGIQWNHMCRVSGVVEISSFSSLFPLWMRVAKVWVLGYCSPTSILGKIFWDLGMVEVRGWGGVLPRAQVCIPAFLSWNQLFSDCPIPEITWGTFYKFNSLPPPSSRDRVRLHGSVRTCSLAEIKCKSQIHSSPPHPPAPCCQLLCSQCPLSLPGLARRQWFSQQRWDIRSSYLLFFFF